MTTLEILRAARELISDPAKWTQGAYARDEKGFQLCTGYDTGATCWCAIGALEHIYASMSELEAIRYLTLAVSEWPAKVNDHKGHAAVLDMYDRAIALAEKEKDAK